MGILEVAAAVMGVAVSWQGTRVLHVVHEGEDMHLTIAQDGRAGRGHSTFDEDQFNMMGVMVMLSSRMGSDLLETKQFPEMIGHSNCGIARIDRHV